MENEMELIEKAKSGDKQAFGELVLHFRKNVCGLAYRFIGDITEAEDMAQEVFVRAYLALPGFVPAHPGAFKSWLLTITSRCCIDYSRRNRHRILQMELPPEHELALAESQDGVPEIVFREETRQMVQQALLRLPPNYRMAIALKYLEDLNYREIASIIGVPIGTVGTWIRRGLNFLRNDLQRKGVDSDAKLAAR